MDTSGPWYAQRGEDRKLVELLGDPTRYRGFYIDVGAWEPMIDSVTKHFYDVGWSGINIEPIPYYFKKIEEARPRDINLNVAASDNLGVATITHYLNSGLSTLHPQFSQEFRDRFQAEEIKVPTMTLEIICGLYVPDEMEIDFLKIDVEGFEREVLLGANFMRWRPNIVVIEATKPGTEGETAIPLWDQWENIICKYDYKMIDFDGLNRWYRRGAHTLPREDGRTEP